MSFCDHFSRVAVRNLRPFWIEFLENFLQFWDKSFPEMGLIPRELYDIDLPSCFCAEQIVWRNANLTGINDLAKKDSLRGEIQVVSVIDPARILSSEFEDTGLENIQVPKMDIKLTVRCSAAAL